MILHSGDCLLYSPKGTFGWIISIKTWHQVAHVEISLGDGSSVAARDGVGVGRFPHRADRLVHVVRPAVPFDGEAAVRWFARTANGQGYDWLGLLRFAWRAKVVPDARDARDNKQFCSEFATRFYRAGGLDPFNEEDADAIAPFQFLLSPYLRRVSDE